MTQGYGPEDPSQPGERPPPSYQPQPSYQPPSYQPQASYGPPGQEPYGPPPPGPYAQQPGYGGERPGYYMNRLLANWLQRVGAFLIDLLIYLIPLVIAVAIVASAYDAGSSAISGGAGLVAYLLFLVAFGVHVYNRWFLQGRTGQSWGKRALGLKLLRMDNGQPIGGGMAIARDLAHILDVLPCYLGYLWPLWDSRRQTFADKVTDTVVIAD
jgi:uncharacterized RDD family membrane protein YckC